VIVLKPGLVVAGLVKDDRGQPLSGAKVTKSRAVAYGPYDQTTQLTGADGRFRFGDVIEGELTLSVQVDGFVGRSLSVRPTVQTPETVIELARAAVLRGRVLDEGGYVQLRVKELKNRGVVRLQAWGRIEGSLRAGNQAGATEPVWLSNTHSNSPPPLSVILTGRGHAPYTGRAVRSGNG